MLTCVRLLTTMNMSTNDLVKVVYAFTDARTNIIRYGLLIRDGLEGIRGRNPHMTAYLNLPKADWLKVDDMIRDKYNITFEGIESSRISVGSKMERKVPILVSDFWIGIDYMGRDRGWQDAASDLMAVCNAINIELEKCDAEDSSI